MVGDNGLRRGRENPLPRYAIGTRGNARSRRRRRDTMPVRVLIVDDHPAFRRALTSALRMVDGFEVAGEAGGGEAACREAAALRPDVVLMDLSMPDLSGIEAMKEIHEREP